MLPITTLAGKSVPSIARKAVMNMLRRIWQLGKAYGNDQNVFQHYFNTLQKEVNQHVKPVSFEAGKPNWQYYANMRYNVAVFAAFKNHSEQKELARMLTDGEKPRSYKEFKAEALKVTGKYNTRWLQTEYNHAAQSARMAAKWKTFQENTDLYPNLRYVAIMDERTRSSHRDLHGLVYPKNHPFWNTHYPPNDWGCRCSVQETDLDTNTVEDPPKPSKGFENNPGKTAAIFDSENAYWQDASPAERNRAMAFAHQYAAPAQYIEDSYNTFKGYGNAYKKAFFDGNTGGFNVYHERHQFNKKGGPIEKKAGKKLARQGKQVEFINEIGPKQKGDIKMDNKEWDIKGITNPTSTAVKNQIKQGRKTGYVIIEFQDEKNLGILREGIDRFIGEAKAYNLRVPEIWYFNENEILTKLKQK